MLVSRKEDNVLVLFICFKNGLFQEQEENQVLFQKEEEERTGVCVFQKNRKKTRNNKQLTTAQLTTNN